MKIQATISEPVVSNRIIKEQKRRKHTKASRTVRELAMERLKQVEDYGDVPLIPARLAST